MAIFFNFLVPSFLFQYTFMQTLLIQPTQGEVPIQDYFINMNKKDIPIILCRGYSEGVLWRLPPKIECPLVNITKPSKVLKMTIWWQDITKQSISAYECFKETVYERKSYFFFGTYSSEKNTKRETVSVHDCHNIVYKDIAPNGQKLKMIADGLFWTGNTYPSLEYTWPRTQEVLTVNYFFINMKISINNEDDTIITMTKVLDTCKAQHGHCPTQDGILIWKSEDVDHCRLAEGETTDCLYTANRISCPALNLAISDPKTISMCKRTIGYSKQGLMFTPINNSEVDFISLSTHKFREVVQGKVKVKRDIMKPLLFPKVKLDAQVNGELQFLYDALRDDVSYALQIIHRDTCKSQQLELELVRALAEFGQSSITVRALTRDGRCRSTLRGDVLSVFKCTEIWEYMLRQTNCTLEYPVSYMYQHQKHEGWIQGLSHEIVQSPTMTSCPAPVWVFDMGNKVIQLSNHSLPASTIPYLPSPRETAEYPTIRDLSFDQTGIYSLKQISGETTILDLMQQLQERTRISDLIKTKEEGASFNTEQIRLSRLIQDITLDPIRKYVNITITICITLLIVYILYTLLKFHRLRLGNEFPFLRNLPIFGHIFTNQEIQIENSATAPNDLLLFSNETQSDSDSLTQESRIQMEPLISNQSLEVNAIQSEYPNASLYALKRVKY
ncbi:Envelope glycoprotein B [Folsomia candida]|uniref:Envelope glycoprotein B n=1 Tax=Folsomia candida TaxID=158441 RepID=A0A226D3E5_FOLCA|nr:Envelope glycoprotein B [Folsomia candida]